MASRSGISRSLRWAAQPTRLQANNTTAYSTERIHPPGLKFPEWNETRRVAYRPGSARGRELPRFRREELPAALVARTPLTHADGRRGRVHRAHVEHPVVAVRVHRVPRVHEVALAVVLALRLTHAAVQPVPHTLRIHRADPRGSRVVGHVQRHHVLQ